MWFWLTPNGTCRPGDGDFRFWRQRPADRVEPSPAADTADHAGQRFWQAGWYFDRGWLNRLWYPHPLVYAAAAGLALAGLGVMLRRRAQGIIAVTLFLWCLYFSAVTVIAGAPEYRYRMVLEPVMVVAVATAVCGRRRGTGILPVPGPGSGKMPVPPNRAALEVKHDGT